MKLMDFFMGRVRPAPGVAPQSMTAVQAALLALDRPTAPWTVRQATLTEDCDLVAEWRIVDANWYWLFSRNALKKSFTIYMRFDPSTRTVRSLDRMATLDWSLGWPNPGLEGEVSWGNFTERSFGAGIGFTEELRPGVVYEYRFATFEIKGPLQQTTTALGWTWQAVGLGAL